MTIPDGGTIRLPWDAADPYPYYEYRRRDGDVVWDEQAGAWLVLGYEPAKRVLTEPGWTSDPLANPGAAPAFAGLDPDTLRHNMLFADGADHRRLRGAARDVFTPAFVAGMSDGIEAVAAAAIDELPCGTEFDLMGEVAVPLPIAVAAAWMDLDEESGRLLRAESPAISRMLSDFSAADAVEAGAAAFTALIAELLPAAADRRTYPGDDLLSYLAAEPTVDLEDIVTTAVIIAVAGHETTANLLGAAVVRLVDAGVHAVDDRLVSELLRLDAPVQAVARTATRDHVLGSVGIGAGEPVLVVLAAANRDPTVFDDPDRLRGDRAGPAPLAFGYGPHYCLGAALARLEIGIALRRILARRPRRCGEPVWRDTPAIRGLQALPVAFTA